MGKARTALLKIENLLPVDNDPYDGTANKPIREAVEAGLEDDDTVDFDLTTVDGLLDHLAHCEDEVVQGVREGLAAWEKAAQERSARIEANRLAVDLKHPDAILGDHLGWCSPANGGCNRVRWLAVVTRSDSATGLPVEGVCRTCARENPELVKGL